MATTPDSGTDRRHTGAPPRAQLVAAVVLALGLAAVIAVFGVLANRGAEQAGTDADGPLALVPVPAPRATTPECAKVVRGAPQQLMSNGRTLSRRVLAVPAPVATVAWGAEPVVLRCGLDRPAELTPTAPLRVIDGVQWLVVSGGDGAGTWYVVDRPVYLALTVPDSAGTGPLQEVSADAATLPPTPLRFQG